MQDKATIEQDRLGWPHPVSVGFAVAVHVAGVWLGHLSAVETVQEASGDLCNHGSVWDGLGHAVDRSLKQQEDTREFTSVQQLLHSDHHHETTRRIVLKFGKQIHLFLAFIFCLNILFSMEQVLFFF